VSSSLASLERRESESEHISPQPDGNRSWDPGGKVRSTRLHHAISSVGTPTTEASDATSNSESRTDLDTHANMPVVGRHVCVLATTGKMVEVSPHAPDCKAMQVPLVDAAVRCDCPHEGKSHILAIRNALHVPSMNNNLIPLFLLREAGTTVNDAPKTQITDPCESDHATTFPDTGF